MTSFCVGLTVNKASIKHMLVMYSNYYSTVTYYICSERVDTTVWVLVEVRTYNLSAASSDLTTRKKNMP